MGIAFTIKTCNALNLDVRIEELIMLNLVLLVGNWDKEVSGKKVIEYGK